MRRIIIIRGVHDTGKTTKVNDIAEWIIGKYGIENTLVENKNGDILGVLRVDNLIIGLNSSGDNLAEVEKIRQLKDGEDNYPDIIICASRTKGAPHNYFKENFGYNNGWLKVYHNVRKLNTDDERKIRDERIIEEIKTRLIGVRK